MPQTGGQSVRDYTAPVRASITLTFSPIHGAAQVLVRAPFFRICADSTLRGPDQSIVARYADQAWQLGSRSCRAFHCTDPIYLRVTGSDGRRAHLGPYDFVRVEGGALFTQVERLGAHGAGWNSDETQAPLWREVTLLQLPPDGRR